MFNLKNFIREVPDWPQRGVNFKDITTILENPVVFKQVVDELIKPFKTNPIDKIAVIDARGFIFGAVIAYNLGVGISLIHKKGKLPFKTISQEYQKEYGVDILTMHEDTIKKGEKVLLVDDLLATGGTIEASTKMIESLGGEIIGISVVVNLPFLGGSEKLKQKYFLNHLIEYSN